MRILCSSETPGGRLEGVPEPFCREPGEKVEPETMDEAVGVAAPELGRDPDSDAVDSNSLCSDGFDWRKGREPSDEAGDARCLGRIMDFSRSAAYCGGLGGPSCSGVMGGSGGAPWRFWVRAGVAEVRACILATRLPVADLESFCGG
jgi:hypothetical protein